MAEELVSPKLETMDKFAFRKHIASSFLKQFVFASIIIMLLKFQKFDLENLSTLVFLILVCITSVASICLIFEVSKYRKRFNDIYPDTKFGIHWYLALALCPIFFFSFTVFLCLKDPVPNVRTSIRFRTLSLAFVPVLCLQLVNPGFSYFFASSSIYFAIETFHVSGRVIAYNKQLKNSDGVIENYFEKYGEPKHSTEKILLLASVAASIIKDKNKISKDPKNVSNSMKYGERLISSIIDIYYVTDKDFAISSYSPFQWMHPGGPLEILLIEGLENGIMYKFHKTLIDKNMDMISRMEKQVNRLPASEQEIYKEKFKKHRKSIELSRAYKQEILEREIRSFPVK